MQLHIDTYRLLRKIGKYKALTTMEIVELTGRKRSSVLKRLHKLEKAGYMENKMDEDRKFYWKVIKIPEKPKPKLIKRESLSLEELKDKHDRRYLQESTS